MNDYAAKYEIGFTYAIFLLDFSILHAL